MTDNQSPDGLISKSEDLIAQELAIVGLSRPAAKEVAAARAEALALKESKAKGKARYENMPYLTGLAFSGGGIRSATVSLGVMQKLAACGILKQVDYLSTVSGGGFIGSALTWWLRKRPDGSPLYDTGENLPYGTNDPATPDAPEPDGKPKHPPLSFLRQHGLYLTPGNDITVWSGIAVVLRTILLNLLVWVPMAAFVFLAMLLASRLPFLNGLPHLIATLSPRALPALSEAVGSSQAVAATDLFPPFFLLLLVVAGVLAVIFLLASFNYSLLSWTVRPESLTAKAKKQPIVKVTRLGWIWAAAYAVTGLAVLVLVVIWLLDPAKVLFDYASVPEPKSGGLVRQWQWIAFFCVIGLALVVKFEKEQWSVKEAAAALKRQLNVVLVIAAFPLLAAIDAVLSPDWWPDWLWPIARVSALLQFFAGICFLVFANYWVGFAMRQALRFVQVEDGTFEIEKPSAQRLEYDGRRLFEIFFGKTLWLILVLVAIGVLPLLNAFIEFGLGGIEGLFAVVAGLTSTVMGHLRASSKGDSRWTNLFIMVGAGLFTYGVLLVGYRLAVVILTGDVLQKSVIATLFIVAAASGWFANINYIGLHRFYRDRLMEAFMPSDKTVEDSASSASYDANTPHDETVKDGASSASHEANQFRVAEAWSAKESRGEVGGPYHIVNTNVVLTNSNTRQFRQRGGDNFIITPAFVGSRATGWRAMADYTNNDITLASAMAASGAAANPRGGVGGKGITRSKSVSIIMGLLNIRLGYWLHNPRATRHASFFSRLARRPNHFWPGGFYALTPKGYREDSKWLEVSDGAHFENLAVYELIRRRCGLIIVCDGGQDNKSSYSDLVTAVQRVGEDFGVAIRFDVKVKDGNDDLKTSGPAMLVARTSKDQFPKGAEFADKGYFVATIEYPANTVEPWPKKGVLLYLKSALIESLHIKAKGYRGAHADFPNESTADQFFDEEQFEAYREVGYRICTQMVEDLGLCVMFKNDKRPTLEQIREQLNAGQAKAP